MKEKKQDLNLISVKEMEKEINKGSPMWILALRESQEEDPKEPPQEVTKILEDFKD